MYPSISACCLAKVWSTSAHSYPIRKWTKTRKPCVSNISQTSQGEYRVVEDRYSITMTSKWAQWCLKSPASRLLTQPFYAQIKENTKAPHKWPVTRKMISFWWRHHARMIFLVNSHVQNQATNMAVQFQRVSVKSKTNQRHSVVI